MYLPRTLERGLSDYSQAPLSVVHMSWTVCLHYCPFPSVPGPWTGNNCWPCWELGCRVTLHCPLALVHHTYSINKKFRHCSPRQQVVVDTRLSRCYCISIPSLFMLAKHMNSVRQRWRTNLSPLSIALTPFAYACTKSGATCPDSGETCVVNKFTKGLDILTN